MRKKVFLFSIGLFSGFLLLASLSGVVSAQGVNCSDRGEFCGTIPRLLEVFECCAGECAGDSCQCLSSVCCKTSIAGNRGVPCYCEEECRAALTCTGGICCDNRADWKRDADEVCYCDVECKSGQCIGGVCFDPAAGDTCGPAGCACVGTARDCEVMLGGEVNSSLTCPNPSFNVCCCDNGGGSPPPPECENRGGECVLTSDCCTGLTCYQITGGPMPTPSGKVCCNPSLNRLDGDLCLCPAECRNNNCFHLFCGGPPSPPPAVCGNGVLEVGEQCDDGNIVNGDGCSSTCISEGGGLPPNGNGGVDWQIGGNGGIIDLKSPLGCTTIEECIGRMINFLFSLAVILTPLMIILAGFLYITAVGKPEKIVQAQKLITWTLIGFLIVSLARAIIYVITSVIGG